MSGSSAERSAVRKEAARKWSKKHENPGGTGRKFLQHASAPGIREELPPPRPPRGRRTPRLDSPPVCQLIKVSSAAQHQLILSLYASSAAGENFNRVMTQLGSCQGVPLVPDANVWLHGISSVDGYQDCVAIIKMIEGGRLTPCASSGAIAEITTVGERMLRQGYLTPQDYTGLTKVLELAINIDSLPLAPSMAERPTLPEDPSDAKYVVAAAKANWFSPQKPVPLVTMDRHLLKAPGEILNRVEIMTPHAFLDWLSTK